MINMWAAFMVNKPEVLGVIWQYTIQQEELFIQFLLDPTCLPLVISSKKNHPDIVKHCLFLSRTWCFSSHLTRTKLLKQWQFLVCKVNSTVPCLCYDLKSIIVFASWQINDWLQKKNKLGLSCAKLRASFGLPGFDSVWSVRYSRFGRFGKVGLVW